MTDRLRLAHDLATQITPVARVWRALADRVLASLAISNSEGWALVHIARLGDGARQAELARAIGITEASLTPTVRQLEQAGLVERRADPSDRRVNRLHLTAAGRRMAGRAEALLVDVRARMLDGVPDADLAVAVRLLETIAARAAAMREEP